MVATKTGLSDDKFAPFFITGAELVVLLNLMENMYTEIA